MIGIYKISNLVSGNNYIGQSTDIHKRWRSHKSEAFSNNRQRDYPLYRAIRKYGLENFEFSILEECSQKLLNTRELFWIKEYDSCNNGYNQTFDTNVKAHGKLLCLQQVIEIKNLLLNTDISQRELGDKYKVSSRTICDINLGQSWVDENIQYPIRKQYNDITIAKRYCVDCGIKILHKGGGRCSKCSGIARRIVERPIREELKQLIRTVSYAEIARRYNVTPPTIFSWCIVYNLPKRKKEIKLYSDIEWEKI